MTDKSVQKRIAVERAIVRALVKESIAQGYTVSLHDGNDDGWLAVEQSTNVAEIMRSIMTVDVETLYFYRDGARESWVQLIYGNDGWDVIADYGQKMESVVDSEPVKSLVEKYG